MQDLAWLMEAARRWKQNGRLTGTDRERPPNPATLPWKEGRSAIGGTPEKKPPQHMAAVPKAPGVASRTKPGTVPPRLRGYRPEVRQ